MRILLVSHSFRVVTHGPAKFAQAVYHAAQRNPKVSLDILTEDPPQENLPGIFPVRSYPWVMRLPLGKIKLSLNYYFNIRRLKRAGHTYDFVVFNDGSSGVITSLFRPRHQKAVGMINDLDYVTARRDQASSDGRNWVHHGHFYVERFAARRFDRVIANSHFLAKVLQRGYRLRRLPAVLYKAVETESLSYLPPGYISGEVNILFVKSDYLVGGLAELLAACGQLAPTPIRLTIIGPPTNVLAQEEWEIPTNVRLDCRGPQPQDAVFSAMQAADIFCVPSRREGLGVANLEALVLGTTVVSTAVGGIPEALNGAANGFLAENCTASAIATALRKAIDADLELRRSKSRFGRAWVEAHFSQSAMVQQFFTTLQESKQAVR